jgi:uracil-DNA glycosylase
MAWGTPAGKRVQKIDRQKHLVLQSVHPSPLSAARGFFDCKHFKLSNEWLSSRYGPEGEIDWALVPGNSTKPVVKETAAKSEAKSADKDAKVEVKKVELKTDDKENEFADDEEALEEALALAEAEVTKKDD